MEPLRVSDMRLQSKSITLGVRTERRIIPFTTVLNVLLFSYTFYLSKLKLDVEK